jgi:hypothetical protein
MTTAGASATCVGSSSGSSFSLMRLSSSPCTHAPVLLESRVTYLVLSTTNSFVASNLAIIMSSTSTRRASIAATVAASTPPSNPFAVPQGLRAAPSQACKPGNFVARFLVRQQGWHVDWSRVKRATIGVPAGASPGTKVRWEVTVLVLGNESKFGWASVSFAADREAQAGVGETEDSWALDGKGNLAWHNGEATPWPVSWAAGDVLGFAADLSTRELWCAVNGEWAAAPFAARQADGHAADGGIFPALSMQGGMVLLNTGGTGFRYPPASATPPPTTRLQRCLPTRR